MDATRIDRWLHAVRLAKSRSTATDACASGRVRINDTVAKPATQVRVGDRVEVRARGATRSVEVLDVIDRRVGAPIAAGCYLEQIDPTEVDRPDAVVAPPPVTRERGSGRPTKRDRRELDRLRGRRR